MASFFSSGFFGFGKKRSSNKKFARDLDDDTDKEKSYPRAKSTGSFKATSMRMNPAKMMMDESPFAGATPAATGSWIACHDIDGNPYWWNDVTGEWTYQLYSTSSYTPPHMLPSYLYQQQYGPQYVLGHQQQQQQQQQQPYLGSPSGAHHQSPWGPMVVPGMGFGGQEQGDGFANQSETWEKFVDSNGRPFWIHSATGQRAAGYASN